MNTEERQKILLERKFILEKLGQACDDIQEYLNKGGFLSKSDKSLPKTVSHRIQLISLSMRSEGDCVIKRCSCGKKYTPSEWDALSFVGYQSSTAVSGEMRNCGCESTLLIITKRPKQ